MWAVFAPPVLPLALALVRLLLYRKSERARRRFSRAASRLGTWRALGTRVRPKRDRLERHRSDRVRPKRIEKEYRPMNENSKTIVFVVVACIAVLRRVSHETPVRAGGTSKIIRGEATVSRLQGRPLGNRHRNCQIRRKDRDRSAVQGGTGEGDYGRFLRTTTTPADAKDQLADVAADMVDLSILEQASDSRGDQDSTASSIRTRRSSNRDPPASESR